MTRQRAKDLVQEGGTAELRRGHVHADRRDQGQDQAPLRDQAARLVQHRRRQVVDEPVALGHLHERHGRDRLAVPGPPRQRLHAVDLTGLENLHRLQVQAHVTLRQGCPQRRRHPVVAALLERHALLEDHQPALALALGGVHGRVRLVQELVRRGADGLGGQLDDADARRDAHGAAVQRERRGQRGGHGVRDGQDVPVVLEQDGELVPAEAGHGVAPPQGARQALSDADQELITGRVPEAVVDDLEVVQVEEDQRDRAQVTGVQLQGVSEPVGEQGPVGQPREGIVEGKVAQLGLALGELPGQRGVLAEGQVLPEQHQADDAAPHVQLTGGDGAPGQRQGQGDAGGRHHRDVGVQAGAVHDRRAAAQVLDDVALHERGQGQQDEADDPAQVQDSPVVRAGGRQVGERAVGHAQGRHAGGRQSQGHPRTTAAQGQHDEHEQQHVADGVRQRHRHLEVGAAGAEHGPEHGLPGHHRQRRRGQRRVQDPSAAIARAAG